MGSYGADMKQYLPDGNEARIKAAYANRDPRLAMNVITPYATYLGGVTGSAISYTLRWPYRGAMMRSLMIFGQTLMINFII